MTTATAEQFVFLRRHASASSLTPPTRLTEKETRTLLATAGRKNIDGLIEKLKAGGTITTTFGTYTAEPI